MPKKTNTSLCCKNMYDPMLEGYVMFAIIRDEHQQPCDYQFLEVNRQFENISGVQREEVIGRTLKQMQNHSPEVWLDICDNLNKIQGNGLFEYFLKKDDRHFQVSAFCPSDDIVITVFLEITAQKRAEEALRIHKILFEGAQDIILYTNLDGQVMDSNQRACEAYGYTKEQLLSRRIQEIRHPSTLDEYEGQMRQAEIGGVLFECLHVRCDGSTFPVEVSSRVAYTEKGPLRIHIIRDITLRKMQEAKIAWLANYDTLTGIRNRASLMMQLEQEIQRCARSSSQFAVMLFDIDKFKSVNDHYGHEAGDVVLRHVSAKVQQALRTTDQIGRLGGDEFVILQTAVKELAGVGRLAERIQAAAAEPITYNGISLRVSISIGISLFPADAGDVDSLLACADQAMYVTKKRGGSNYAFFMGDTPPAQT